jgi:hypothetical protein
MTSSQKKENNLKSSPVFRSGIPVNRVNGPDCPLQENPPSLLSGLAKYALFSGK